MAFSKQFVKALDELFRQRTHWLRSELGLVKPGQPPKFSRQKVNAGIKKLQKIASNALTHKLAKIEFEKHITKPKSWHIKGRGPDDKKKRFNEWYKRIGITSKGCIYVFWGNSHKSEYVGKTGSGGSRPSSHFEKYWFPRVKRITIFAVKSKTQIPKLECLAIHRFRPIHNKNKAATKKWAKTCPIHKIYNSIESELRSIFRLR
jgi:hypothetical protein